MSLVLTGFSQQVSLANPEDVEYFLMFSDPKTGKVIRLPVQQETTEALIQEVYGQKEKTNAVAEPGMLDAPDGEGDVSGDFNSSLDSRSDALTGEAAEFSYSDTLQDQDEDFDGFEDEQEVAYVPESEDEVESL